MSAWADRNARQHVPEKYGGEASYRWIAGQANEHGCKLVFDLGGGHAYLHHFLPIDNYLNIDGAGGPLVDVVHDITEPAPNLDEFELEDFGPRLRAVVLRHVLDHNEDWPKIIDNLPSWEPTVVLIVLYMPLAQEETHVADWDPIGVPEIRFYLPDVVACLHRADFDVEVVQPFFGGETYIIARPR